MTPALSRFLSRHAERENALPGVRRRAGAGAEPRLGVESPSLAPAKSAARRHFSPLRRGRRRRAASFVARLVSRNGVEHTRRFADIAAALAKLSARTLVLDGEVAVYDEQLRSRFKWLREPDPRAVATPPPLMVFDLLYHGAGK